MKQLTIITVLLFSLISVSNSFHTPMSRRHGRSGVQISPISPCTTTILYDAITEVARGEDGESSELSKVTGFSGCSIRLPDPERITEYEITIDGDAADLAKFSEAIYKKILGDAKNQRFQGFR